MLPQISGVKAEFKIEDGYFNIQSRYINFNFHMDMGTIRKTHHDVDLEAFLDKREVELLVKCPECESNGRYYCYVGIYKSNPDKTHMDIYSFTEKVAYDGIMLNQFPFRGKAKVEVYKQFNVSGTDADTSHFKRAKIDIHYIDLARTSPDKLKNKIKTYITFS